MTDEYTAGIGADYGVLGYVDNPFAEPDATADDPAWVRLATRAASNRLITAVLRAREKGRPVLVRMSEAIPDYYYRVATGDFLGRTAHDPKLDMMTLTIPLDIMRVGRIRGTLIELSELVAAVDLPVTVAAYLAKGLAAPDTALPEYAPLTEDQLETARLLFAEDPHAAVARFLGPRPEQPAHSLDDEDEALRQAYLRSVPLARDPSKEDEPESEAVEDAAAVPASEPAADEEPAGDAGEEVEEPRDPDEEMRDYILALVRSDLSPVVARALSEYRSWGEAIVAQELKVTKAPRKTLAAVLRLMQARWGTVVAIYEGLEPWPLLDHQARMDVLAALTELRWIIGETGVMGIALYEGMAPEVEEQFAGAEPVDWGMPELEALSQGDRSFVAATVQSWLDAASLTGVSDLKADGAEFAPLVEAAANDIERFGLMASAALADAATRGVSALDDQAIAAGLAAAETEDHA